MKAYKLVRVLKNGDITPLFINKTQRIKVGEWLEAESHRTQGYAFRPGWHCTSTPNAPHLSSKGMICVTEDHEVITECTPEQEAQGILETIYEDGVFHNQQTLTQIREKVDKLAGL